MYHRVPGYKCFVETHFTGICNSAVLAYSVHTRVQALLGKCTLYWQKANAALGSKFLTVALVVRVVVPLSIPVLQLRAFTIRALLGGKGYCLLKIDTTIHVGLFL